MFCPKCGKMNNDNDELCNGCGAQLHEENESTTKKKRGGAAKIIVSVAVALAIMTAAAAYVFVSCDASPDESCTTNIYVALI